MYAALEPLQSEGHAVDAEGPLHEWLRRYIRAHCFGISKSLSKNSYPPLTKGEGETPGAS
jgi:hypothetical protein